MQKIQVKNLRFSIDNKEILKDISFDVPKGSFVGIIGPNGSGKSTLLKNIYRLYKPSSGKIILDNKDLFTMKDKECAKEIAVLAQESNSQFDFTVEQIVKMGRYPYKSVFEDYSKDDLKMVSEMLKKVGLDDYSHRSFSNLSGGEKQRALIARALVQNTDFLILDEPTNHLDIGYQIQLMDLVKSMKITTLSAIHDMNIASMYCDYLIVMKDGKIKKFGNVEEVITAQTLKEIFGVNAYVGKNPINKKLQVSFMHTHEHINGVGNNHIHEDGFTGLHSHEENQIYV
ncbi:MAG: ABC transporter ATP-binding protein [Terrisporobacter othiniensis]|uniref:ABC transporter ATP-binding protein n=1 Tax=Terrisporobacter hibernicus TaxID=2813371 RepID=A0AAX2ZBY5_9FIRM|nr:MULTISPECIES: ABC transporter ATP-binding protein [Terrisporobacter]MDU4861884.1 ABC transporter ATP-binding protein [Terrisporobacter othiniensis]UPA30221.1 ABC transporter ATP-binding protein [Terrisporobacter glycolicus]MCC3863845.1 ABC transporter ATP-binding protein [Terrisporobacter petrolearius]MDU6995819.1 ABC transporter ATP-binding protein [Terrisporobacter othiniensis]UEL46165.1 ABC transporter ATP-binding protein [Terrisporobacter hibernicus]